MRRMNGLTRGVVLCSLAGFVVLLGGLELRPAAAGDDLDAVRAETWRRMTRELAGRGIHVVPPEAGRSGTRASSEADVPTSLLLVRGHPSRAERFEMPTYELKAEGAVGVNRLRTYRMLKRAPTKWGRPATLQLAIHKVGTREPPLQAEQDPRENRSKVGVLVDFQPKSSFTTSGIARNARKLESFYARRVTAQRVRRSYTEARTYAGLEGSAFVLERSGLLPGRPVARIQGGGTVHDGVHEGVHLERALIRARHHLNMLWITLTVDATSHTTADPDSVWEKAEIHEIAEAFASAYLEAARSTDIPKAGAVRILDANPLSTGGRRIAELDSPLELHRRVQEERNAVAADGTTRVVLEIEVEKPCVVRVEAPDSSADPLDPGAVEMLFGGRAVPVGAGTQRRTVAYALYTAPASFAEPRSGTAGQDLSAPTRLSGTRTVDLDLSIGPSLAELQPSPTPVKVSLVRPPVILVHGTFDGPTACWETDARELEPTAGSESMATALRRAGYTVFKVDYRWTNGNVFPWGDPDQSSFEANKRVLWERKEGIFEALSVYRNKLDIAVTQTDVVGHSMGGVIPRLWVSNAYNPSDGEALVFDRMRTRGYRRADNFGAGDIHRLVTIGTTHMGSDFGHLGIALREAPVDARKVLMSALMPGAHGTELVKQIIEEFGAWGLGVWAGYGISEAVRNQRPLLEMLPNPALTKIGPTRVPAHAIVCAASIPDLRTFREHFKTKFKIVAWWMLNSRPEVVKAFFEARGQAEDLDRIYGELFYLDQRGRKADEAAGLWLFEDGERLAPKDEFTLYGLARAIMFGNTQNDMVVRVESQAGGLPLQFTTFRRGVLHSFATRYAHVQTAVVAALTGPAWRFAPEGFPAPHPMRNIERYRTEQDPAERAEAIAISNIVPSHAESLSYVADKEDIIIVMRPVNRYATRLIQLGNATKDMHVKGKSSNWGPQRGYIPVEQRFSKLHSLDDTKRAEQIRKFDGKVRDCLASRRARETPLRVSAGGMTHDVLVIEGDDLEPPRAIVLRAPDGQWKGWQRDGSLEFEPNADLPSHPLSAEEIKRRGTRPLLVLADRHSGLALTADYDILAFGPPRKPPFEGSKVQSDPEMGYVTPWQIELIRKMNNEVRLRGNYAGGNVSHHGPETQFVFSEGADYPNVAFEADGDIVVIREGPAGRKDLNLKTYFHRMRSLGFQLTPNRHTWTWGPYDPERWPSTGWRPEDTTQLMSAKVLEEDNPFDSDEGDEPVPTGTKAGGR